MRRGGEVTAVQLDTLANSSGVRVSFESKEHKGVRLLSLKTEKQPLKATVLEEPSPPSHACSSLVVYTVEEA